MVGGWVGIVRSIIGIYIYLYISLIFADCILQLVRFGVCVCVSVCGIVVWCVCLSLFWAVFDTFLGSLITFKSLYDRLTSNKPSNNI